MSATPEPNLDELDPLPDVAPNRPLRADTGQRRAAGVQRSEGAQATAGASPAGSRDVWRGARKLSSSTTARPTAAARVLDQSAARFPEVRVVHFSRNFGHQAAVHAGLKHATGHCVVVMDSDLQDDAAAIGRMLDCWRGGYDVVYARRVRRKEAIWKRALFAGFHRLMAAVATTPIPADAGNFSLIDARAVRQIIELAERDRYLPGLRSWVGFRQIGIEVRRNARYDLQPRVSLRGLWRLAKTAIFSFSSLPLSAFYLLGYAALAVFLGLGSYSLYCRLFTSLAIPGWTSYILSASFFGAINALGISMLGEYVVRIYDQVRARPLYLVDRTVNFTAAVDAVRAIPTAQLVHEPRQTETDPHDALLAAAGELLALSAEAQAEQFASAAERKPAECYHTA